MKIIAVGGNYRAHQLEMQELGLTPPAAEEPRTEPTEPIIFLKGDALLRRGFPFFVPDFSQDIHYECEMVLRIDRIGKHIAERFAHRYYSEISVGIDFTARSLQRKAKEAGQPWALSKAFDNSAAVGQWVNKHEAGIDVDNVEIRLDVDGKTVQRASTAEMIHSADKLIAYVSQYMTLRMGDLIFTGTPAGVGPIVIGQRLEGYLNGNKLLDIPIK